MKVARYSRRFLTSHDVKLTYTGNKSVRYEHNLNDMHVTVSLVLGGPPVLVYFDMKVIDANTVVLTNPSCYRGNRYYRLEFPGLFVSVKSEKSDE